MFFADLTFNLLLLLVEISVILSWLRSDQALDLKRCQRGIEIIYFLALSLILLITIVTFKLSFFSIMRFVGMALLWHFPLMLCVMAWRYKGHQILRIAALLLAGLLLSSYVYAYHIEPYRLQISEYHYSHPKLAGLSRPVRIAQLADIQTDQVGAYERRVFTTLAELQPDLVLYCGDFAACWTQEEYRNVMAELGEVLRQSGWEPPLGAYAVSGNIDGIGIFQDCIAEWPVEHIEDRSKRLTLPGNVQVNLIGLSNFNSYRLDDEVIRSIRRNCSPELLDLYLGHRPDYALSLATQDRPFLAFAGHTHGGQVQLPFLGPLITLSRVPRENTDDFLPLGSGVLSVSRGIGMERGDAPRLRFLCPPEIRIITLTPPENS